MSAPADAFPVTERFVQRRLLGAGAFGSVFEAHDLEQDTVVALKTLHRFDAGALFRFKQEFRALAELQHRNLVSLYELFSDGASWFFTMELVTGVDFVTYVRHRTRTPTHEESVTMARVTRMKSVSGPERRHEPDGTGREASGVNDGQAGTAQVDPGRLRESLLQLATGVQTLHDHGILHRDIKPSNVLVTPEGRVVLFDFGLLSFTETVDREQAIVGTPVYMAPELVGGGRLSEASDWYSVGVVLFQALTGDNPFSGTTPELLQRKRVFDAPTPHTDHPELDELCKDLLVRDAERRPLGRAILRRLGGHVPKAGSEERGVSAGTTTFIGRRRALATLGEAHDTMHRGGTSLVRVHGSSGMGKTALVRSFLASLAASDPETVVLSGRCFERESVPYKAMDSLVDSLSQYLARLDPAEAELYVPEDYHAAVRLFPVLASMPGASEASARRPVDSQEMRLRAFAAIRELFHKMAKRHPMVLYFDDLQWGDLDSAALLGEILRSPEPPPLMLIGCYRSEEAATSTFLKEALPVWSEMSRELKSFEIPLGELGNDEARELAKVLMASTGVPVSGERADRIARESAGNPFFIDQLVRHEQREPTKVSLDQVIHERVAELPDDAIRLLQVAAVAAQPVDVVAATSAAALKTRSPETLTLLRNAHFIRTRETESSDEIEPYHDRIRETVVRALPEETLRRHHHRLGVALEQSGRADPETLMEHFRQAGVADSAARYAREAARQAADALAFDRAARLFRLALSLDVGDEAVRHELRVQLGHALAAAGRGTEAADTLLAAASSAEPKERVELQREASEQYLISGRIAEGMRALRIVLRSVGMRLPKTPARAAFLLVLRQAFLRVRGLGFRERSESEVPEALLRQLDVCHTTCRGLGLTDVLFGLEFQARHLMLALRAGEPYRISRALGFEASSAATSARTYKRSKKLLELATSIAERIQHPHALGLARLNTGIVSVLQARWKTARSQLTAAGEVFEDGCVGVRHEFDIIDIFNMDCLFYLGELKAYLESLPELIHGAHARGDLYAEASLGLRRSHVACLVHDDPDTAEAQLREALAQWGQDGFHVQHSTELFRRVEIALYRGDPESVWAWSQERWREMTRSLLLHVQVIRIIAHDNRARLALALAGKSEADSKRKAMFLKIAEKDANRLSKESREWASAMASAIEASLAVYRGERQPALDLLARAEELFDAADMKMHELACARQRGLLMGDDTGRAKADEVERWLLEQGVSKPHRWADALLPGKWSIR